MLLETASNDKPIGGFFELELPAAKGSYHPNAIALSTGRACLRMMIRHLDISKCYLPFYTCDALFHPFDIEDVPYECYGIDHQMEPTHLPKLKQGEYFLYINYFGVKSETVSKLLNYYGEQLLIDNTHLFFHKGYSQNWSFTSARKYFGVPDGAYLYSPIEISDLPDRFTGISLAHNLSRALGRQAQGYNEYTDYERSLDASVCRISDVSEKLLSLIDYEQVAKTRRENFQYLHEQLSPVNQLTIEGAVSEVPFAYPFMPEKLLDKKEFYKKNVFIPVLWSDPLQKPGELMQQEKRFAEGLLPIPIDHRYNTDDMERIVDVARRLL